MSKWIIELPDSLDNPYFCSLCHPHECNGARGCPIPNAKKATEVTGMMKFCVVNSDGSGAYLRGKPAKVYAVEEE